MKIVTGIALLVAVGFGALALAFTPASLSASYTSPSVPPVEDLDRWLEENERRASQAIIEGTEKRIRWIEPGKKTPISLVYLHGFSATRQETAPTMERVADLLQANLFETRLTGHGLSREPLTNVQAESWLSDAAEALAIGRELGERVVLVGTSTGATLSAAVADHPLMESVSDVIWISPNFGLRDSRAEMVTWPAGRLLARLMVGETRSFETLNDDHALYWTTEYPTDAAVEMMRLVRYVKELPILPVTADVMLIYSPDDKIISPDAALETLSRTMSERTKTIEFQDADDPNQHVIAGDILSPSGTDALTSLIVDFIRPELSTQE